MPLLHCKECHHEWESAPIEVFEYKGQTKCDWCGSKSYTLEEKTTLEKFVENGLAFKTLSGINK